MLFWNFVEEFVVCLHAVPTNTLDSSGKGEYSMATTNWATAEAFQTKLPHTFNALQHLVMAMVLDRVIERNTPPSHARTELIKAIEVFAATFPNWQEAYTFANEFLVDSGCSRRPNSMCNAIRTHQR